MMSAVLFNDFGILAEHLRKSAVGYVPSDDV